MKFVKKGSLAQTDAGKLAILDENQKAYEADELVVSIWDQCDGNKTEEQIIDDLAEKVNTEKNHVKEAVSTIIARLEQIGLVEKS